MAGETKVGLLAGFAFIVCFAIILANRGRDEFISAQLPRFANDPVAVDLGMRQADRLGQSNAPNPAGQRAVPSPAPRRPSKPPASDHDPELGTAGTREGTGTPATSEAKPRDPARSVSSGRDIPDHRPVRTTLASPSHDPAERVRILERKLEELSARVGPDVQTGAGPASEPQRRVVPPTLAPVTRPVGYSATATYHTVAAGDTLTKIATEHYGTKSHTCVNAIFDANRSILSNPDELRVGIKLTLPDIEIADSPQRPPPVAAPVGPGPIEPPAATPPRGTGPFRWYQIKKDDGYIRIAREQLGDQSRWREIYELNKDKFPDAGMIRVGVRIKIPLAGLADAGGGRR